MTPFQRLNDAISHYKSGRPNVAKTIWLELPQDFRKRVLKFVVFGIQYSGKFPGVITFESPFGEIVVYQAWLDELVEVIPELGNGS
jgi:hypothetical protein